jgi:hypothetical protein
MSNACRILVGKPGTTCPLGRLVRKFENVIKTNMEETAGGRRTIKETVEQT